MSSLVSVVVFLLVSVSSAQSDTCTTVASGDNCTSNEECCSGRCKFNKEGCFKKQHPEGVQCNHDDECWTKCKDKLCTAGTKKEGEECLVQNFERGWDCESGLVCTFDNAERTGNVKCVKDIPVNKAEDDKPTTASNPGTGIHSHCTANDLVRTDATDSDYYKKDCDTNAISKCLENVWGQSGGNSWKVAEVKACYDKNTCYKDCDKCLVRQAESFIPIFGFKVEINDAGWYCLDESESVCKAREVNFALWCTWQGGGGGDKKPDCFSRETEACKVIDTSFSPAEAFRACFDEASLKMAERVPMTALVAGDLVLSSHTEITRVIVNQHVLAKSTSPMIDIYHADGTLSVTPDHVILVDGQFVPARDVKKGAILSSGAAVTAVTHSRDGIINPITASGRILAAGSTGKAVVASTYGEWIASFMIGRSTLSLSRGIAYLFPETTQAYYGSTLEPLFDVSMPALTAATATMPTPLVSLTMVAGDILLFAGFIFFSAASIKASVAIVALVTIAHARKV